MRLDHLLSRESGRQAGRKPWVAWYKGKERVLYYCSILRALAKELSKEAQQPKRETVGV